MYVIKLVDPQTSRSTSSITTRLFPEEKNWPTPPKQRDFYIYSKDTFTSTPYKDIPNLLSEQNFIGDFDKT